jgi:hypothetical protein
MTDSSLIEIDELKMYFGEPFYINEKIAIYIPTVGEIVEFGERKYYSMVHTLTCIPSDMKSQLFDMGYDYEEMSDFELFMMLSRNLPQETTKLVLGDLDLTKFGIFTNTDNNELVLYDEENGIVIDKLIYMKMVEYIRKVHNIKPKVEKAANKTTKKILIQLDRDKIKKSQKEPYKSQLKDLISAMMRYPGFKYKSNELKQCGLYEFMDTVQGAQIYISSTALLQGSYSGMIDTSKINKKEFNWMRSLNE